LAFTIFTLSFRSLLHVIVMLILVDDVLEGYECENHTLRQSRGQIRSRMYPVLNVSAACEHWNILVPGPITIR